jgi:hypothetical protein
MHVFAHDVIRRSSQTRVISSNRSGAGFIEIGAETVDVEARELPNDEREAAWAQITAIAPPFAKYQTLTPAAVRAVPPLREQS